jgi:hypothetical protein
MDWFLIVPLLALLLAVPGPEWRHRPHRTE